MATDFQYLPGRTAILRWRSGCLHRKGYSLKSPDGQKLHLVTARDKDYLLHGKMKSSCVGISGPYRNFADFKIGAKGATEARLTAFVKGNSVEFESEEFRQIKEKKFFSYPEGTMEQLTAMMGTEHAEEAVGKILQFLLDARFYKYSPEELCAQMKRFFQKTASLYKSLMENQEEQLYRLENPWLYSSLDMYREEVEKCLEELAGTIRGQMDDSTNQYKIKQAVAYIRENYNRDLNMAVISNHLSMNYSQFSFVFKQFTGKNFVNYLKDLRIEEAKRMLETTDYRVAEISQMVGYENEKHFMKVFKSVCGISPTEYRKNAGFQ